MTAMTVAHTRTPDDPFVMSFCPESDPEHSERRPYIPNPRLHTRAPRRTRPPRLQSAAPLTPSHSENPSPADRDRRTKCVPALRFGVFSKILPFYTCFCTAFFFNM